MVGNDANYLGRLFLSLALWNVPTVWWGLSHMGLLRIAIVLEKLRLGGAIMYQRHAGPKDSFAFVGYNLYTLHVI